MKRVSSAGTKQVRNVSQRKLTIGLYDLAVIRARGLLKAVPFYSAADEIATAKDPRYNSDRVKLWSN
jgi:hypothetical protein